MGNIMKVFIGVLILTFSLFPVCMGGDGWAQTLARMNVGIVGGSVPAGGATYPDILFWLNFEANDTTGDYNLGASECAATSGDTSGAYVSGATISSATYKVGSYALSIPTAYDGFQFGAANIVNTTEGRVGFWLYIDSDVRDTQAYFEVYVDANNFIKIYALGADGQDIGFQYKSGGTSNPWVETSTNPLTQDAWYFIEAYWKSGASGLLVNGVSVATDADSFTAFNVSTGVVRFSSDSTDYQYPYLIDNVMISNDSDRDFCGRDAGECKGLAIAITKPSGACP